jgi:hypothetical protein
VITEGTTSAWRARQGPIRIGAVAALALAVAFVVWLVVRGNDSTSPARTTAAAPATAPKTKPTRVRTLVTAATPTKLRALSSRTGHPIYWAGSKPKITYELTRISNGQIYVRYLPKGVRVGDRHAAYLLVATYPIANAYKAVKTAAKESGAVTFRIAHGGIAVYNQSATRNVYFAYPGSKYQVEVFDPKPGRARRLVKSGAIRPIA